MKRFFVLSLFVFTVVGCASTEGAKSAMPQTQKPKIEETRVEQAVPEEKNLPQKALIGEGSQPAPAEDIHFPKFERGVPEKALPPHEPIEPKNVVRAEGRVSINVENMPLSDFINYAFGTSLKVSFFIDEQVKNMKDPITLRMTGDLPADTVFEMVMGVLERKDIIIEEKGGAIYILKPKPGIPKPVDIRTGRDVKDSPADILQIVVLKYIRTGEIDGLLRELYGKTGVTVKMHPRENALMLLGQASGIKEMMGFIEIFDVPFVQGKKAFIIKLTYWQTDEFVRQVTQILTGMGFNIAGSSRDPGIMFIPIKFLNSILVIVPDDTSAKYILEWKAKLDTAESAGKEEKAWTYVPKYSKASDLLDALKRLYTVAAAPAPQQTAKPSAQEQSSAQIITAGLKVSADDKRNVILILTAPAEYRSILTYLEKLDIPPRQVLIEVTLMELTLTDELQYGLEWYIKTKAHDTSFTLQTLDQLGIGGSGFIFNILSDSQKIQAVINAFAQKDKVNILSRPRLMVLDNEESTIQIGTDVPILSSESKSTSGDTQTTITSQSVQYRNTGLILRVKPTINTEGTLTLSLSLESSEAQTNSLSDINSPLILKRSLSTSIAAASAQSVILGGIMSENISLTETKVPLLGDIPLFGNLFKTNSKAKTKTELIMLLTPTILTTIDEAVKLTDEIRGGMKLAE